MVAPLTYGAGQKGKITQSMAAGLPVVTTPVGAEGLGTKDGDELLVGSDAREIADLVVRAYRDDDLWRRLSRGGQALVAKRFSRVLLDTRLAELLGENSREPLAVEPL